MAQMRSLEELREAVAAGLPFRRGLLAELRRDERAGAQALRDTCRKLRAAERKECRRLEKMMEFERDVQANGFAVVAGVDEAGRGPLAGPLVAAAVILRAPVAKVNDSKQLTAEEREELFHVLHDEGHAIGVGMVQHEEIDVMGLQQANYSAMAQAVHNLSRAPDFLLVDGFRIPGLLVPMKPIIKGDCRSLSIAAASIIAKVTRDRIMIALDPQYPEYGFARHKGYRTREHLEALTIHGPCAIHRKSFAPIARADETALLFDLA